MKDTALAAQTLIEALTAADPKMVERIKRIAQAEGSKDWRTTAMRFVVKAVRVATGGDDLRPAEVAFLRGCSLKTVYRDLAAGAYPNARWKNQRVVYIPRGDLERN